MIIGGANLKTKSRGLTKREFQELVDVINVMDVVDCFGVYDCVLRQKLEAKATENQLWRAWHKATGGSWEEFDRTYY